MTSTTQTGLSVQDVARRTGFSEATLRYYERIGLIPPVPRDSSSRHRRFPVALVEQLEALACLRASGAGIDDMRDYLTDVDRDDRQALVALFARHAERLEVEIENLHRRHRYALTKVRLWQSRVDEDVDAEATALQDAAAATADLRAGA